MDDVIDRSVIELASLAGHAAEAMSTSAIFCTTNLHGWCSDGVVPR